MDSSINHRVQSGLGSSQRSGIGGAGLDPVKINQIFDKIFHSNNLEIEERNLKNLAQKMSHKLIDCGYLISNHGTQLQRLFEWLNTRATPLFQGEAGMSPPGTVCSMQAVQNFCSIFAVVSQSMEGRALILQSGGKEIYNGLMNCQALQYESQILQTVEVIMRNLIQSGGAEASSGLGMTASFNQVPQVQAPQVQAQTQDLDRELSVTNEIIEEGQAQIRFQEDVRSEFTGLQQSTIGGFSRRNFSLNQPSQVHPQANPHGGVTHQGSTINSQFQANQSQFQTMGQSYVASQMASSNIQAVMLQSGINQSHMEIMHKQQILKEECELPFIVLSDGDEKHLFDLSVALKFGNHQTIFQSCQKLQYQYFNDFPPEVFLQRTDTLKALLDLLEGSSGAQAQSQQSHEYDLTQLAQSCLLTYVKKLRNLYRFLLNNGCKPNVMQKDSFDLPDETNESLKSKQFVDNYIEKTYPCNRLSRWDTSLEGLKSQSKYGVNQRSKSYGAAASKQSQGGHNTLSCRAVLGLILTKSIYLLQDTDKLGLFIQLIQESLEALNYIFNVKKNNEFSEFIHLCLFAFDKVCDFYREQLFDEVLIQPVLTLLLKFIDLLNTIQPSASSSLAQLAQSSSQSLDRASKQGSSAASTQRTLASRFKAPFTETLFKNTENLQRMLRRALFRYQYSEETDSDKYKIILQFFERLENSQEMGESANLLQRNVQKSFFKAQTCFAKFVRVTDFRVDIDQISSGNMDQFCFVRTQDQLHQALSILQDLSECIEMKMDFPFEHLILDCIYFVGLTEESSYEGGAASRAADIEKLVQTYMAIPIAEVRERILRRIYQKLRIPAAGGPNTVLDQQRPQALSNNIYVARFILRKGLLNHFVNGILINRDIAQNEESKLQMNIGQLIVKIIILAFNEIQSQQDHQKIQPTNFVQTLSQFLLTFQCLLPQYNDLISLIELIEEGGQKNCRYLRILRDLFSSVEHKREFATNVLRSSFSLDCQDDHIKDMLKNCIDLRQPSGRVAQNLELINSNYDFSTFGIQDITNILMTNQTGSGGQQDYSIKRSSLEQLTMVLFDVQNKRGRFLFSQSEAIQDVFTYVLEETLSAHNSSKNALKGRVSNLSKDQVLYVNECIRFMLYSYIFFNDEQIVQGFFNKVKGMISNKKNQDDSESSSGVQISQFEQLLNALVYFMGSAILRENCILLLYIQVYQQLWICTKVSKAQAPSGQLLRNLTILIPDFCQESIYQLIPYSIQAIRMPARDDLILSEEQKMYIDYRFQNNHKLNDEYQQLEQVAAQFSQSISSMRAQDYRKVLMTGVEPWKNYLLSIEAMRQPLMNPNTLTSLVELLKILPTRDYEFYDLADLLNVLQQILTSHERTLNITAEQLRLESQSNFEEFLIRVMDALKYHLMPYLEETGVTGISEGDSSDNSENTPKSYLLYRYLQLLDIMITSDIARKKPGASILIQYLQASPFLQYLISLFQFYKSNFVMKRLLLSVFWQIILHYRPTDSQILSQLCDTLVDQVSSMKMIYNQFEQTSIVMWSLRIMIVLSQRRQLVINNNALSAEDAMINAGLSETYQSKIDKFKSFGWIMRFAESRDARVRVLTWDLLIELFDYEFLKSHPSVIHQCINSYLKNNELYCIKISNLKFLNKVCDALMRNCDRDDDNANSDLNQIYRGTAQSDQIEQMTVKTLLQTLNRQGLISQIHKILSQKDCPLIFMTLTLQLLHNLTQMDYQKAIPVLTQLDYWTFLVELLDIKALMQIEKQESREILRDMRGDYLEDESQPSPLLNFPDPCQSLDMVYMALNSILDFLFEAFKRDSQLAALLVKTTKLMQSTFYLVQYTLEKHRQDCQNGSQTLLLRNKGLLTVFIDKIIKILHVAMLHPQDYSVDLISKFIFEQPLSSENGSSKLPRNWLYFIDMFQIIEMFNQTLGFTDIKLALIRFISEFLIQTAHFENNYLDELVSLNEDLIGKQDGPQFIYNSDLNTYGSMFFIEFAKVFKHLYIDLKKQPQYDDQENQKKDITLCLEILFSSCKSAKTLAVDQNFLKKVIDICQENASAIYVAELQKYSQNKSAKNGSSQGQRMFEQQLHRQFKYVSDVNDIELCEREATRMLQLTRNLFFDSQNLLLAFSVANPDANQFSKLESVQAARNTKKPSVKKDAFASQSEKLLNLLGQILEELGSQRQFEQIICECLMTMITFAGQNIKFKNLFLQPINVSTQSKRVTLLKLVGDKIHTFGNLQSNSRVLRLLFTLMRSLSISPDAAKEIMKMRFIEEIVGKITPQIKNDKDIKLCKYYLGHFMSFMSAFTSTEEGSKQILKIKQSFEIPLFILDTVNIPAVPETSVIEGEFSMTPVNQLVTQILLFIRNATIDSRQNKVHFLKNDDFLPCLMAFLSAPNHHPKIKAYTAGVLWSLVHNHQGIKAAINRSAVISELQLMKSEYQRTVDKENYMGYINQPGKTGSSPQTDEQKYENYEYHANYTLADTPKNIEENQVMVADMNAFILKALTGILTLIQS